MPTLRDKMIMAEAAAGRGLCLDGFPHDLCEEIESKVPPDIYNQGTHRIMKYLEGDDKAQKSRLLREIQNKRDEIKAQTSKRLTNVSELSPAMQTMIQDIVPAYMVSSSLDTIEAYLVLQLR